MRTFSILLTFLVTTSIFAQDVWKKDDAHSQVSFGIVHLGISEVEGVFNDFDATITSSKEDFSDAVIEASIDVASVDTHIGMRDDHLRNEDFFHVEKYPEMTFKSNSIKQVSDDHYEVTGDLNFHGVTKPITLNLWHRGTIDGKEGKIAGFQITGSLNRSDYNIGEGFPETALSDKVSIKIDGEFKKQ